MVPPSLYIYEWNAWKGYLLPSLFPHAKRIRARIGESHHEVLAPLRAPGWFAFHVNLTESGKLPIDRSVLCRILQARGIRLLNEQVTSISKRRIQVACARAGLKTTWAPRQGDPNELLIVKPIWNYGGEWEARLTRRERLVLGLPKRFGWRGGHADYRRLPRGEVDGRWWNSREMVIERFIENRGHLFYRAYVLLDRLVISRVVDPSPLKKMPIGIARVSWFLDLSELRVVRGDELPMHVASSISAFCREFSLDYGAIDVVQDDYGECYIIDANTTPHWGDGGHPDLLAFLSGGLNQSQGSAKCSISY